MLHGAIQMAMGEPEISDETKGGQVSYSHTKKRKFIRWVKKQMLKDWFKVYSDCFGKDKR